MEAKDLILTAALIFIFAIGFFVVHYVFNTVTDQMIAIPAINESADAVSQFEGVQNLTDRLDYIVFGVFIGSILAIIIGGWFVGGHPILMFIYFIVVTIGVVLSFVLSNVWETVSHSALFGVTVGSFPLSNHLLLNLPIYMVVIGLIGMIAMFAKPGGN